MVVFGRDHIYTSVALLSHLSQMYPLDMYPQRQDTNSTKHLFTKTDYWQCGDQSSQPRRQYDACEEMMLQTRPERVPAQRQHVSHSLSQLVNTIRKSRTPTRRVLVGEQLPNHRHRNLKAFEDHFPKHVSSCFVTDQYL